MMEELLLLHQDVDLFAAHMSRQRDVWAALSREESRPQLCGYAMLRATEFQDCSWEAERVLGDIERFLDNRPAIRAHLAEVRRSFFA
jgi:hypothetical protein